MKKYYIQILEHDDYEMLFGNIDLSKSRVFLLKMEADSIFSAIREARKQYPEKRIFYCDEAKTGGSTMKLHKKYGDYINNSKDGALQLIADLSVGYDGYNTVKSLKALIKELGDIALLGLKQKK